MGITCTEIKMTATDGDNVKTTIQQTRSGRGQRELGGIERALMSNREICDDSTCLIVFIFSS